MSHRLYWKMSWVFCGFCSALLSFTSQVCPKALNYPFHLKWFNKGTFGNLCSFLLLSFDFLLDPLNHSCQVLCRHISFGWDISVDSPKQTAWLLPALSCSRGGKTSPLGASLCPTDHMACPGASTWVSWSTGHLRQQELP